MGVQLARCRNGPLAALQSAANRPGAAGATAFADLDSGMVAHYANGLAIIKAAYGLTIRLRCRPACAAGKDCLDGIDFKLHMQLPASVFCSVLC